MKHDRFHGRVNGATGGCDWPECAEQGEFRAPCQNTRGALSPGFDGPGNYRWFCLEHIRAFNAGYDYFAGMSADEILRAQSPIHGWERESRAFSPTAGVDFAPRWGDFADPLDAIRARSRGLKPEMRSDGRVLTLDERRAFDLLKLPYDADVKLLRKQYAAMVRQYHPDKNGGDRSFETVLQRVVEAYQLLRNAEIFS
ncbi:MAG: hypothetical protein RLY97_1671 [Pseudomonadota bacterium]